MNVIGLSFINLSVNPVWSNLFIFFNFIFICFIWPYHLEPCAYFSQSFRDRIVYSCCNLKKCGSLGSSIFKNNLVIVLVLEASLFLTYWRNDCKIQVKTDECDLFNERLNTLLTKGSPLSIRDNVTCMSSKISKTVSGKFTVKVLGDF